MSLGQTAYYYAVQGAEALGWASVARGVDPDGENPEGYSGLHSAAHANQPTVLRALLRPQRPPPSWLTVRLMSPMRLLIANPSELLGLGFGSGIPRWMISSMR